MKYLKILNQPLLPLDRAYLTVGYGPGFDVTLSGDGGICFAVRREKDELHLTPGDNPVEINGTLIKKSAKLEVCDRLSWKGGLAVIVGEPVSGETNPKAALLPKCFDILQRLASRLDTDRSLELALEEALSDLVELSGAEVGHLVSELSKEGEWEVLASIGTEEMTPAQRKKELISSTILSQAIESRKPVYVESIVGHPLAAQASVMEARLFSFACLPLTVGKRVFGCVYLFTRTPGRSIQKDSLEELTILATQASLLLASLSQLRKSQQKVRKLTKGRESDEILYDRAADKHPMKDIEARIHKLAPTDLNILIGGDTGTGKELAAREIHKGSSRAEKPLVTVNCGAIPPSLMESTLFGYVKGAFTGANRDHPGKIRAAHGGTLFLDEIGDLSLDLQVKLLRVLQEKAVEPVGSTESIPADFRVVAATHRDLEAAVRDNKFREDLYYRLNGASVKLPPLKDRGSDIMVLAEHFLKEIDPSGEFSEEAKKELQNHSWPGNIRELKQVISRSAALSQTSTIEKEDLELGAPLKTSALEEWWDIEGDLKAAQSAFTVAYVKKALEKADGHRSKAAASLGISERTLYRILSDAPDSSV